MKDHNGNIIDVGDMITVGHEENEYQVVGFTETDVLCHCVNRDYTFTAPIDGFHLWHWRKVDQGEPQWKIERQLAEQRMVINNGKSPFVGGVDQPDLIPFINPNHTVAIKELMQLGIDYAPSVIDQIDNNDPRRN